VGYFHGFMDGVDYVFVDHPAYHHVASDIYAGSRTDILFRCALLCKVCNLCYYLVCNSSPAARFSVLGRTTLLHEN
jgi:starch synthase